MNPSLIARAAVGAVWNVELLRKNHGHYKRHGELLVVENTFVDQGLTYIGGVAFKGVTPAAGWYLAPYKGNYTPVANETAATISAAATEATEYNETTRVQWQPGAISGNAMDNTANKAQFTLNAEIDIYGGFLVSSAAKAANTGVLGSVIKLPTVKHGEPTDILLFTCALGFASAT